MADPIPFAPLAPGEPGYVPDRDWRRDGKEPCGHASPIGFRCTREDGHGGDHMAHDLGGVLCERWPR